VNKPAPAAAGPSVRRLDFSPLVDKISRPKSRAPAAFPAIEEESPVEVETPSEPAVERLEFAPTIVSLILAGKVGSNIASTLGTMRVTEQMDALRVMGINPASYLVLPKIAACLLFNPILVIFGMLLGMVGGYLAGDLLNLVNIEVYLSGYFMEFFPHYVTYSLTKTFVFAFIIATVSAFFGYRVEGGAVEVGKASTKSVVAMSFTIILFNYILTDILL